LALAVWYAWYVTTHTIPGMVKEFRDEVKEQRQAARADVNKIGESGTGISGWPTTGRGAQKYS
jgi:hypothetical protein